MGCQDTTFTIKTLLNLLHNYNLTTWVAFFDLVKAFDTSNHQLMVMILEKYGCPPNLCDTIKRMYKDSMVKLVIGSFETKIEFKVGVKQGDIVVPVQFLFFVMAFAKTLERDWTLNGLTKAKFSPNTNSPFSDGQLISHTMLSFDHGALFELFCIIYVYYRAFVFESIQQLEIGIPLILWHFGQFGLKMHIGKKNKNSRTECVFLPSPGYFTFSTMPNSNNRTTTSFSITVKVKK